jgi:hypothetical protein
MGKYDTKTKWPKEFYDTGGGSYGLLNPNKIQSGTLMGTVQVGNQGPTLDPNNGQLSLGPTGSIVGSGPNPIIINSGGITFPSNQNIFLQGGSNIYINGSQVLTAANATGSINLLGPFIISFPAPGMGSGDGVTLFTVNPNDMIYAIWCETSVAWNGTWASDRMYCSFDMSTFDNSTPANFRGAANGNDLYEFQTNVVTSTAGLSAPLAGQINRGAQISQNPTFRPIRMLQQKNICVRFAQATDGNVGGSIIYALVIRASN